MVIDWSNAPKWARYAAQDLTGESWWFETKPETSYLFDDWRYGGRTKKITPKRNPKWKETLQERPKNEEITNE